VEFGDLEVGRHVARRTILAAAALLVNACASAGRIGPASQDVAWRAYLGSQQRASAVAESILGDPQPIWRTDVGRGVVGAPALTEDLVAVSQVDRQVALLDRSTGDIIWRHRLRANIGSGPLIDDDRLYVATQTDAGQVVALALRTGKQAWATALGDVAAPLALHDAVVVAATVEGRVAALRAATGRPVWRVRLSGAVRAAPVITGAGVLVATTDDSLFLLDGATGAVRERRATVGTVLAAPAVAGGLVLVGTTAGHLEACDSATLVPRWRLDVGGEVVGSVAVQGRAAYVLTALGDLWTVPLDAPERAHSVPLGIVARAGPTPVAGGVIVAAIDGQLALVDASTGERRWSARIQPPVVQPVIAGERFLVATSERGAVVAFR
jgi:outer membrane protein assembly factor BamB